MLISRILISILVIVGLSACGPTIQVEDLPPTPPPVIDVVPEPPVPPVVTPEPEPEPEVPILEPEDLPEKPEVPEIEPVKVPVKFKGGLTAPTPMGCREGIDVDC